MFKFLLNQIMNALFLSIATVMNFNNNYTQALGLDFFFFVSFAAHTLLSIANPGENMAV